MVLISPLYLASKKNLKKFSLVSCIGNSSGKILTIEVTNKIYLDELLDIIYYSKHFKQNYYFKILCFSFYDYFWQNIEM